MSYVNADDVLPEYLLTEIQKYVDGQLLYIPRKENCGLAWGEKSGAKEKLAERNDQIFRKYSAGTTLSDLSSEYCLSEKRIQGIIREYESSSKNKDMYGGFRNEQREQKKTV